MSSSYLTLLTTYLKPHKKRVALLTLLILSGITLQLANPQLVRIFIDAVENGDPLNKLIGAASLFTVIAIIRQIIILISAYVGEDIAWLATNNLRADLAHHCLQLDMGFHKKHKPGELIERVDGDVNLLANFFSQLIIRLASNLILLSGILILLWLLDWRIGASITAIALAGMFAVRWLNARIVPLWETMRHSTTNLFGYLEEWITGTEDIRTSGAEPYIMNQLHTLNRERWLAWLRAMKFNTLVINLPVVVFTLAYIFAHILGNTLFRDSALTIGSIYLIFYYIDVIKGPVWEILRQVQDLQQASASLNRIQTLLNETATLKDGTGVDFPAGALTIQFNQVSFHYADDPHHTILNNINFTLRPGTKLGLLGRTGSGKSTLTKLLFRLYDPTSGTITLGGHDLRHAQQSQLRQHIGLVTQDVQLFHATIRDNLTLFDDTITDQHLAHTLQELGLTDWINTLPAGLQTKLAAHNTLSAGQAQLLAFARIFLANPSLIILDEASSRLDPATEQQIERALDKLLHNRTAIIVAHRLTTVQRADQIMILANGHIQEHGPRTDLIANPNSHFTHMLQTGL